MQRIINHWTAGTYTVSALDREHYHFIISGKPEIILGRFPVSANRPGIRLQAGRYAAHTLGCNSGSIGVACASMVGAIENPFRAGECPLKEEQWNMMVGLNAKLCKEFKIPVTPQTVLTHAEAQKNLGKPQRGKWDISKLVFAPHNTAAQVGDFLRREVLKQLK